MKRGEHSILLEIDTRRTFIASLHKNVLMRKRSHGGKPVDAIAARAMCRKMRRLVSKRADSFRWTVREDFATFPDSGRWGLCDVRDASQTTYSGRLTTLHLDFQPVATRASPVNSTRLVEPAVSQTVKGDCRTLFPLCLF